MLCFFVLPDGTSRSGKAAPTLQPKMFTEMNLLLLFLNVCERLFEELVKELLEDHFTIVSGSYREVDGKMVRVRKAHLRRRKRRH